MAGRAGVTGFWIAKGSLGLKQLSQEVTWLGEKGTEEFPTRVLGRKGLGVRIPHLREIETEVQIPGSRGGEGSRGLDFWGKRECRLRIPGLEKQILPWTVVSWEEGAGDWTSVSDPCCLSVFWRSGRKVQRRWS